jgi:membrane protease YdiL (CAAX protease family)
VIKLPAGDARAFLFLLAVIVSFLAYWLTIESSAVKGGFSRRFGEERGSVLFFIFNKLWGVFWFGIVCTTAALLLFPGHGLADFGFAMPASGPSLQSSLAWSAALALILVLGNWMRCRKIARTGRDFGRYPEIRARAWTMPILCADVGLWLVYLLAYELLFRGTLLLPLAQELGPWPAVGINIALYSAVHVPKGAGEAVGALLLGFLLCLITLATGSILVAFTAHAALAVSNELFAFHYSPGMRYAGSRRAEAGT